MIFALIDYEGGFDGFFGMALIQPIIALIVSSISALACFVIGLPIRLSANIFSWWSNRLYIQLAMLMIGITLLILSIIPQNMDQVILSGDLNNTKMIPDKLFSLSGWFITAFSLMHILEMFQRFLNI